ncbi:MAG: hypothetical protein JO263_05090 [Candidatus Eremiobacteraeota bacterium]|nr:hypothetical protein [Candidatus Eremiobacteraeota bacterium]
MRIYGLIVLIALAACQSPAGAPPLRVLPSGAAREPTQPKTATYLYASAAPLNNASIERFRLSNGVPAKKPDLVYPGYGGSLAVGGDGTLYAGYGTTSGTGVIDVFPPGTTRPAREILVPNISAQCRAGPGGFTGINAVAADAKGYVLAAIYTSPFAALRRAWKGHLPWPCEGVAIYPPGAMGYVHPSQVIRYSGAIIDIAVDAADRLYVAHDRVIVDEFKNAIVAPTRTRTFRSRFVGYVKTIATGARADVFIAGTDWEYRNGHIDRFDSHSKGHGPPASLITLGPGAHLLLSMAEHGRVLYVDDTDKTVDLYHAYQGGPQSPFYSLPVTKVFSIAVGP